MEDDPLKPWFGDDEDEEDERTSEEQQDELRKLVQHHYEFGHITDPAEIVCFAQQDGHFSKQAFVDKINQLDQNEFDRFCIRLIQWQGFHESIMGCAGTENEEYIPDELIKNFIIKKRFDDKVPELDESKHNLTSAGILAQKSKTSKGYSKAVFINALHNLADSDFEAMCGDIKWFSWQNDFLSDKLHTHKPFAIPPKLRSHFWINGIDDEHFFVYEPFPHDTDVAFIQKHSRTVDEFITAIEGLAQDQFNAVCKKIIQGHYFVYKVSGMVGTDLPDRIPVELKEHFSKMDLEETEVPALEPVYAGHFHLKTRPGLIFQDLFNGKNYSKRDLIYKVESMSEAQFEKFAYDSGFVIHLYFSFKDHLFTYAYHAIPKELRMYFRYFDIRERVFTQRLDEYFGDTEPNNPMWI